MRGLPSNDKKSDDSMTATAVSGLDLVDPSKSEDVSCSTEEKSSQPSNISSEASSTAYMNSQDGDIVIGIKVKGGITRKLASMNDGPITIAVNGPFESFFPLHRFQQVVCFAGGVGITAIIGNLQHLLQKTDSLPNSEVRLYWAVRKIKEFKWAVDILENMPIPIRLDIYCTQEDVSLSLSEMSEFLCCSPDTRVINGRMDIRYIVDNEVDFINTDSHPSRNSTAIIACGPASLNLDTRQAACWAIKNAAAFIDYFEEQFD